MGFFTALLVSTVAPAMRYKYGTRLSCKGFTGLFTSIRQPVNCLPIFNRFIQFLSPSKLATHYQSFIYQFNYFIYPTML